MQFGSLLYSEYSCKIYTDDDNKSDRNTLVINNIKFKKKIKKNISYTCSFVGFIS